MFITMMMTSMLLTMSSAMMLSMNPVTLGVVILSTALILTLMYSIMLTSWVAFLIFLIYVGGMLVMFAYFVALTPNQQSSILTLPMLIMYVSSMTVMMMIKPSTTIPQVSMNFMSTFYQTNNIFLLMLLAIILLFTMIVVVKIVTNNKGPLRPFMNYV